MKQIFRIFIVAVVFSTLGLTTAMAQSELAEGFMQNQFYGNRIQLGSVLLNGSFQRTGYSREELDGVTGRLGIGAGLGLSENVAFVVGFGRERTRDIYFDQLGQILNTYQTMSAFQAGFRFLPNTRGGFIQPYIGTDFVLLRYDMRNTPDDEPFLENKYAGVNVPVGVIVWISTFMSVSMELFNFNMLGNVGDDVEYNAVFNAEINMLNPTFGISFLINGKKPG